MAQLRPDARQAVVADDQADATLAKVVRSLYADLPWSQARALCDRGHVLVSGSTTRNAARRMQTGERVEVVPVARPRAPKPTGLPEILHLDRDLVVVNKPTGIVTVPYAAGDRETLLELTRGALRKRDRRGHGELGVVQRLDKETTGVMLFARTLTAKRILQQQWRVHSIERRYLALCHGRPRDATHETFLLQDRGDGLRGSHGRYRRARGAPPAAAKRAVTHISPRQPLGPASLVECRLETGRQHQIRIHLSEAGHPLLGEAVYIRDYAGRKLKAPRVMLHAHTLGLDHPRTGERLRFTVDPPDDFEACLAALRR